MQIGGIEVDLAGLLHSINSHGGFQKVIDDMMWDEVLNDLRVPKVVCWVGILDGWVLWDV